MRTVWFDVGQGRETIYNRYFTYGRQQPLQTLSFLLTTLGSDLLLNCAMGSALGTTLPSKSLFHPKIAEKEMVKYLMPVYYIDEKLTEEESKTAADAWNLILNDKSPEYLRRRSSEPNFPYNCCVTFFYDGYYSRLFDIHPNCRPLFKNGMKAQGRFLVKMITLSLSEFEDPERFDRTLVKLAEVHYERGVRACECQFLSSLNIFLWLNSLLFFIDGIVGEVLLWSLRNALGPTIYTLAMHRIWVKIYSRMLTTILPIALALEMKGDGPKDAKGVHGEMFTGRDATTTNSGESKGENGGEVLKCEHLRAANVVQNV